MTAQRKNRIKMLLRQVFWQLDDYSDRELTPRLIRHCLITNVPPKLLDPFALNVTGADWWDRVEKLLRYLESKKHA